MDAHNKSGEQPVQLDAAKLAAELGLYESTLQLYERATDVLIDTLWDDEQERDHVSERDPDVMLELIVAKVKALRMEAGSLRNEVHELEDAAARTRGEAGRG